MAACNNCSDESVRVLPNKDSTSVGRVPENAAKSNRKKGNICPSPVSDFNTLGDDPHTRSEYCYCITQTGSGASWLHRLHRGPDSGWNRGPATFVLGVFAYRLTTSGRVFVLMHQEKKRMESLYLGLSIDRSGACDTAAAPQRLVTH